MAHREPAHGHPGDVHFDACGRAQRANVNDVPAGQHRQQESDTGHGQRSDHLQRYTLFAILGLASADDDDAGKMTEPQKPLQRASQAKQARNNPQQADPQPQGQPGAQSTPPARKPDPDGEAKRQFAVVCDTVAMDFNIIKAAEHLSAREYKGLMAQCQQMSGSDTIVEATQWAIENAKGMVKDEVGTRFIA